MKTGKSTGGEAMQGIDIMYLDISLFSKEG
jgi:hypothetical protein